MKRLFGRIAGTRTSLVATAGICLAAIHVINAATVGANRALNAPTVRGSLAILPVRLGDRPAPRVSEIVALLLEKQGKNDISLMNVADEPVGASETWPVSLAAYLSAHPVRADYVLYAEFNGTRETGLNELRAVVVDAAGAVRWSIRRTPADSAFVRLNAREPMTMATLLAEELGPVFDLDEQTAKAARPGTFQRLMEARSGLPPAEARATLPARQREFSLRRETANILVFPPRIGVRTDSEAAGEIATKLCAAKIGTACAVAPPLMLNAGHADPNEQKALWDLAREFQAFLQSHPVEADYVLYADFGFHPNRWEQGFVHLILCTGRGDWVIVDFQNSHHADYQRVKPTTKSDCSTIVVRRLESYLLKAARDATAEIGVTHAPNRGAGIVAQAFLP